MMKNYKDTYQNTLIKSNTEVDKELVKQLFITLMNEGGVMAQTIMRNYNNKQRGNDEQKSNRFFKEIYVGR
jgi:hypothetical protein